MFFKQYLSPRVYPLLVLGIASGLPLALTSGTLQTWATVENVSLKSIGFLTLVGTAYTFKFVWAPFIDRYVPPMLGRRRGWMVITQILLGIALVGMGFFNPSENLFWLAVLATIVAFLSATQDIAFDAYSTEVLNSDERAAGSAIRTLGYRVGMIVSGGLAVTLAERWLGWGGMYMAMGGLMFIFAIASILAPEPREVQPPRNLEDAFLLPFKEFFSRPEAWMILISIILYKLGDAFAGALSSTFLIRGAGFSAETVAWANKTLAIVATIVGALFGGALMGKLGLYRSLMLFGMLQAVSNLGYWIVSVVPQNLPVMVTAIGVEHLCSGMGTATFIALLMGLCNIKYTATQYALLTALSSIGRVFIAGPVSPIIVEAVGWPIFFIGTVLIAFPGLIVLYWKRDYIRSLG